MEQAGHCTFTWVTVSSSERKSAVSFEALPAMNCPRFAGFLKSVISLTSLVKSGGVLTSCHPPKTMAREMQMPLEHRTHAMLRDVVLGLGLSVFEAASSAMS